jgi:hypothetical protein
MMVEMIEIRIDLEACLNPTSSAAMSTKVAVEKESTGYLKKDLF